MLMQTSYAFPQHEWDLVPEVSGLLPYVGLRNLGCTCYMNSLLQQMFMTPGFGEAILNGQLVLCSVLCFLPHHHHARYVLWFPIPPPVMPVSEPSLLPPLLP